jgi:hypothetical protein
MTQTHKFPYKWRLTDGYPTPGIEYHGCVSRKTNDKKVRQKGCRELLRCNMEQKIIDINLLVENKGQINGVPENPRKIKKERLGALEKSIKDAPEMLNLRELLVFPHNGKYIVIGGNMRLKACKKLGYTQLPCKIIDDDTPVEKLKEYIIKDNNAFGDDDFSKLKLDWNIADLQGWGMDIDFDEKLKARCDLKPQISHVTKSGLFVLCNFRKSKKQTDATILSIKENTDNAEVFADEFILLIQKIIHAPDGWCIITAPKRRHKEMNFAEKICEIASDKTLEPFLLHKYPTNAIIKASSGNPNFLLEESLSLQ